MQLGDIECLERARDLSRFAKRLHLVGYHSRYLASLAKPGERLDDVLRAPLRLWRLRKRKEEAAVVTRLFFDGDEVSESEALYALGEIDAWLDAGLVQRSSDRISSSWRIVPFGDAWIIGDVLAENENAVMAVGGSTVALARAAISPNAIESACDLGCGAGALAIALSRSAKRVAAIDVNPRAVKLAAINARLNGVTNIEARVSDWFSTIASERFDLVVSQPPFAAQLDVESRVTFLHGGARGDELPLRVLSEVEKHLSENGLAFVQCDWPVTSDAIDSRIRNAMGTRGDLVFFQAPNQDLDEVTAHYAAARHRALGDAYVRDAIALREHFEQNQIRALCTGVAVVKHSANGFTAKIAVRHAFDAPITRADVDQYLANAALANDPHRLSTSSFTLAEGVTISGAIVRTAHDAFALSPEDAAALDAILNSRSASSDATRMLLLRGVIQNVPTAPR